MANNSAWLKHCSFAVDVCVRRRHTQAFLPHNPKTKCANEKTKQICISSVVMRSQPPCSKLHQLAKCWVGVVTTTNKQPNDRQRQHHTHHHHHDDDMGAFKCRPVHSNEFEQRTKNRQRTRTTINKKQKQKAKRKTQKTKNKKQKTRKAREDLVAQFVLEFTGTYFT